MPRPVNVSGQCSRSWRQLFVVLWPATDAISFIRARFSQLICIRCQGKQEDTGSDLMAAWTQLLAATTSFPSIFNLRKLEILLWWVERYLLDHKQDTFLGFTLINCPLSNVNTIQLVRGYSGNLVQVQVQVLVLVSHPGYMNKYPDFGICFCFLVTTGFYGGTSLNKVLSSCIYLVKRITRFHKIYGFSPFSSK